MMILYKMDARICEDNKSNMSFPQAFSGNPGKDETMHRPEKC